MPTAHPLDWPDGWPKTPPHQREDGRARFARGTGWNDRKFWTLHSAETGLREEIERLGGADVVVSCNLTRRPDGGIRANQRTPESPGVAVYFTFGGDQVVMARDAFTRVEENLRSLTLAIQGMRQLERHGGGQMMKRAFRGFAALPPPDASIQMGGPGELPRPWHDVLGVATDARWSEVRSAYRERMREASDVEKTAINLAFEAAKKHHA